MHTIKCRIKGVDNDLPRHELSVDGKNKHLPRIAAFKVVAQSVHISQKRRSFAKAWREFLDLYDPTEFFCENKESPMYRDDSLQVWFRTLN